MSIFFLNVHNRFAPVGCGKWTTIVHNQTTIRVCLLPACNVKNPINSCHSTIPPILTSFVAKLTDIPWGNNGYNIGRRSAFMIADNMFNSDGSILETLEIRQMFLQFCNGASQNTAYAIGKKVQIAFLMEMVIVGET